MATNDDGALNRVAEAINDGTPVDWDKELSANRHLTPKLQRLRLVESVAKAHQTSKAETVLPGAENDDSLLATTSVRPALAPQDGIEQLSSWGPLRLMGSLGRGGFGEVYRAFDPTLQREVALKLRRAGRDQDGAAEERFITEARRLASVRHPNVVVVHGADRHEGRAGLWTDLVNGKTLDQVLADQGPFGDHEAATVGITLCGALAAVHGAGLVHRDIKTANIMREQGGRIVLMDFGSVVERDLGDQNTPTHETVSGTPLYMAPELILEGRPASPVSDIYALGVVLFHLVAGRFPIEADTWKELIAKHRDGRRLRLRDLRPEVSPAFVQVVECALDPDPNRRHETAGAMQQALAACSGAPTVAAAASARPAAHGAVWSRRGVVYGLAASLAVVAVAGTLALLPRSGAGPLTAEASIYRLGQGAEDRLLPGGRVRPGDKLFLEIQGREPMYVYVLNEDETGNSFVLFPAGLDLENPLPPGARHRLPGRSADGQMTWQVTSPGRRENFLVIASRTPLDSIERDIAKIPRAELGRQVDSPKVSPESMEEMRGVGGMAVEESPKGRSGAGTLEDLSRRLVAGAAGDRGLWTWHIQLENPE